MLHDYPVYPTIPVSDVQKSRKFYEDTLDLKVIDDSSSDGVLFEAGKGSMLYIYQRDPEVVNHTLAGFQVDNIEQVIDELTGKGITFEHYDFPGLKTDEKGIAVNGPIKAAWFKDPDGHTIGIAQIEK